MILDAEADALCTAAHNASGRQQRSLISLLRRLAPDHSGLAEMDRDAQRYGYARAGSDDRLDPARDAAQAAVDASHAAARASASDVAWDGPQHTVLPKETT